MEPALFTVKQESLCSQNTTYFTVDHLFHCKVFEAGGVEKYIYTEGEGEGDGARGTMYRKRGVMYTSVFLDYSFFFATVNSTTGTRKPAFVPLSLLEDEESRDFLDSKEAPLPWVLPASSSLPVTS